MGSNLGGCLGSPLGFHLHLQPIALGLMMWSSGAKPFPCFKTPLQVQALGCCLDCNKWRTQRSHCGECPSGDVCELSHRLGFPGASVEILRTGSVTALSVSPKRRCRCQTPPPGVPWEQDSSLNRGLPLTPTPRDVSRSWPVAMSCWRLLWAGGCEDRGSFVMLVALPPPTTCAGKREAGAARPPLCRSQRPRQHGDTRCPSDPGCGGERLCKRNCKEYKPSEPNKNTFYFFQPF